MFHEHDDQTTRNVNAALSAGGKSLEDVGSILSATYIDSCLSMGPEISAVYTALSVSQETSDFKQTWREFLVDEFHSPLAAFVKLPKNKFKTLLLGVVGAAEILAEAASAGRMSRNVAIAALRSIMIGALEHAQTQV
jgi:hypothetical protein